MTTTRQIQPLRRVAEILQAVVILGLPFLRIRGESALRFDIPSLRLHFFGVSLWMDEFFIVLIGTMFLTFLIVLVTLLFGRIWCGWACPQTVLVDATKFLDRSRFYGAAKRILSYILTLLLSLVVSASLVWYFVSPYEFLPQLAAGNLGSVAAGFWLVMALIIFLDLALLRRRFCATVCPYAKLQSVLYDSNTLTIAFDAGRTAECMDCRACVRDCPVGIDIRKGASPACVACAACVDACGRMTAKVKRRTLIDYVFGSYGGRLRLLRTNVVMFGILTAVFFVFLLYLSSSRLPLDMTVLPNDTYPPRLATGGQVINAYVLVFENRGSTGRTVRLHAEGASRRAGIAPESVTLAAGESRKVPVYVTLSGGLPRGADEEMDIIAESDDPARISIRKRVHVFVPGR